MIRIKEYFFREQLQQHCSETVAQYVEFLEYLADWHDAKTDPPKRKDSSTVIAVITSEEMGGGEVSLANYHEECGKYTTLEGTEITKQVVMWKSLR